MTDDFLDLIGDITNYVQNVRVASFNEGADEVQKAVRDWMLIEGVRLRNEPGSPSENIPDLLNEIKEHFAASAVIDDRSAADATEVAR